MKREETIEKIKASVSEDSDLVLNVLNREIETMHDEAMSTYCMGVDKEIETYYNQEANEIETEETTTLSQLKLQIKRDLLLQRKQLVDSLFEQIRNNVIENLNGPLYRHFCEKQIENLPSVSLKCELHARKEDKEFLMELLHAKGILPKYVEIQATCGGFLISDPETNFEVDCRLKSRINEQRAWFEGHSGLTL